MILLTFTTILWCSHFAAAAIDHQFNQLQGEISSKLPRDETSSRQRISEEQEQEMLSLQLEKFFQQSIVPNGIMIQLDNNSSYLITHIGNLMGGTMPPKDGNFATTRRINIPFSVLASATKNPKELLRMRPFTLTLRDNGAKMTFQSSNRSSDFLFRADNGKLYYLLHPVPVDAPGLADQNGNQNMYSESVISSVEEPQVSYSEMICPSNNESSFSR